MSYKLGRAAEYRIRDNLREMGYYVVRPAASKGCADLIAFRRDMILFVQVKRSGRLDPGEWNELFDVAQGVGCLPILASTPPRQKPLYWLLTDRKGTAGKRAPKEPFDPSEAITDHDSRYRDAVFKALGCPCDYCAMARAAIADTVDQHRSAA